MPPTDTTTWQAGYEPANHPHLDRDLTVDVAIVGGGMAGVLAAYLLAKDGKDVALLEADALGSGATLRTTAIITSSIDTDARDLVPMFGMERARRIRESHEEAIDLIESVVREERLDCGFARCSSWIFANDAQDLQDLEEEYRAMRRIGYDAVLHRAPVRGFRNAGAIELRNQAKFHPLLFLQGVAKAAEARGARLYERTRADAVEGGDPVRVEAGPHVVRAGHAIIATYQPLGNPWKTFARKGMYVSYVMEAAIPEGVIPEGVYEDTENPYHYFRVDRGQGQDRIVMGGEDHRAEIPLPPRKGFAALREYLDELLDGVPYTVTRRWTGPILEPADGLPQIGEVRRGVLVATAFSGNGMTYSGIAARIFRDLISGRRGRLVALYRPGRVPSLGQLVRKARDYVGILVRGAGRNLFR